MTTALSIPSTVIEQAIAGDPRLLSPHSRRQYCANLREFESWRDGRPMTKTLVEAYTAHLQERGLAPSTINQKLATIRWWARKITDLAHEFAPAEQAKEIEDRAARVAMVGDVRGERLPRGRHIESSELVALLRACMDDKSPAGLRDAAMFALAWTTGLRRAELCELQVDDITPTNDEEAVITVRGKGNKERHAYLFNGAFKALQSWLSVRGLVGGPLLCPVRKGGTIAPDHGLSGEAIRKIINRRILQAGLEKHATPHDFRRTFAGNLLNQNDLATVQALLGHASPTTTSMYDRRPESRRMEAVKGLTVPELERRIRCPSPHTQTSRK